jgi:high-affinity nickel permease
VGLFFSLGHSTLVAALSLLVVVAASVLQGSFAHWKVVGGVIGTGVSAWVCPSGTTVRLTLRINLHLALRKHGATMRKRAPCATFVLSSSCLLSGGPQ